MGFTIFYRSTRPLAKSELQALRTAESTASERRTWLSCEPLNFFPDDDGGHLIGGSKPNFTPHADDVAAAAREGLPDGTARDLLEILCELSREHGVDWEISHDYSDGPIGFVRGGVCDGDVLTQIDAFADLGDALGELTGEFDDESEALFSSLRDDEIEEQSDDDDLDDQGDGPSILSFRPKGT